MIPPLADQASMPGPGAAARARTGSDPRSDTASFADWLSRLSVSPGEAGQAAKYFNEDGFFGEAEAFAGSIRSPDPAPAARAVPLASVPPPIMSLDSLPPDIMFATQVDTAPVMIAAEPAAGPGGRSAASVVQRGAMSADAVFPLPVDRLVGAALVSPPIPPSTRAAAAPSPQPTGSRAAAAPLPPLRPADAGAASPVAVAIRAVETGMAVVARLDRLSEDERVALADAIAALLAMHGFAPGHVAILAPASAPLR